MEQPAFLDAQHPLRPQLLAALTNRPEPKPRPVMPAPNKQGQVFTFGSAVSGELGLGKNVHERRKPGNVKSLNDQQVVAIECGGQHTLALDACGRVWSWGVNDQGALGRITDEDEAIEKKKRKQQQKMQTGDSSEEASSEEEDSDDEEPKGNEASLPQLVDIRKENGQPAFVTQLVCADSFSAVLTLEGHVYAWGSFRDPSGVIGFNKQMERQSQRLPMRITAFGHKKVVLLGSGENHVFAVTDDDTLWAFGANDENQLGRRVSSRFKNNLEPYEIRGHGKRNTTLHNIVRITGGAYHTLYVNTKGELYAMGCNNCGQLGLGDTFSHINGPERVEYCILADGKTRGKLPPIVDVAAGESHSLAVSHDGRLFTWGANLENQLGYEADKPVYGDERDHDSPGRAQKRENSIMSPKRDGVPMDVTPTTSSTATPEGRKHPSPNDAVGTPALLAQHLNDRGDAHLPKREDYKLKYQPLPREVPLGEATDSFVMVDAQSRFSLAVTALGRLYTWGSGHCYQLGNEEMDDETTPFRVELKNRKCFWARCGGQFTMFLLEPKRDSDTPPLLADPMMTTSGDGGPQQGGQYPNGGGPSFQNGSAPGGGAGPGMMNQFMGAGGAGDATQYASYRSNLPVPPSSLPGSPMQSILRTDIITGHTSPVRRSPRSSLQNSPEKMLQAFDNVCVSPERKRLRAEHGASGAGMVADSPRSFTREEKMAPWTPSKRSTTSGRSPFHSPVRGTPAERAAELSFHSPARRAINFSAIVDEPGVTSGVAIGGMLGTRASRSRKTTGEGAVVGGGQGGRGGGMMAGGDMQVEEQGMQPEVVKGTTETVLPQTKRPMRSRNRIRTE